MYNERQKKIIHHLSEVRVAKIEELAELFHVSMETIRRDLMELEKDSSIKRIRGGAVYNNLRAREMELSCNCQ
ncbi:MAG: DeoR/GlpR transcriptional regulator [Lachnospiraceae bacterium]|nr:DeoR/GlpR transcriptional regulator [Lachnospiraceae bacterium]